MEVYRIVKEEYIATALSGKGAAMYGGRWNAIDIPTVYCSYSRALALLETFVNVSKHENLPDDLFLLTISIPDMEAPDYLPPKECPDGWDRLPFTHNSQEVFTNFYQAGMGLAIAVPSVVVPEEYNVLLNPDHEGMSDVNILSHRKVTWDMRM